MGRFNYSEADKYGGNGGTSYFSLKNDKDVARVRFMYGGIDDVEGYAVHQIDIGDRKRYVNCLRNYNDPIDMCPFCSAKKPQYAKLFVPLYDVDEERVKIWERGKKFFDKISSICARYAHGSDLVNHEFEIERNGKAGSTQTTYEIYEVSKDDTTLEDLPDIPPVLGGMVLDKTAEEMEYYLQNGDFPSDGNSDEPIRRRPVEDGREERRNGRRTPASVSTRDRDRF